MPPATDAIVKLPPPPTAPGEQSADAAAVAAHSAALLDRLDLLVVLMVLVFATFCALFPARNSDIFQHLAVGRLVAHGEYHFGSDPFTVAGDKTGWVNHSWLFGLLVFVIYQLPAIGSAAVVVVKALLIAALAGLMLQSSRRPGQRLLVPALMTGLGVLALSPRLLLQPVCVSYLLLGATLWLLEYPTRHPDTERSRMGWWFIPAVCIVWVNFDQWFILGPLTVALYAAGAVMQKEKANATALTAVLAASVAACAVNPFLHKAFALPAQLGFSAGMTELQNEPSFRTLAVMPLQELYFDPRVGLSPAGLAYFPLVFLGVLSFGLTWGAWRWWRVFMWLGYFLFTLYHARAIPFFAIVAGPITALNFLEYFAARQAIHQPSSEASSRGAFLARVLSLVVGVVFLAAGWIGMLQARPTDDRRVGVGVIVDPLLQQAAEEIARRQREAPHEPLVFFNTSEQIVNYLAWFGPGVRGFMDQRLPQFPDAARAFVTARQALAGQDADVGTQAGTGRSEPGYRPVFREWGINHLVLHDADPMRNVPLLERLLSAPAEWPLLIAEGKTVLLGWRDPDSTGTKAGGRTEPLDLRAKAFGTGVTPARFAPPAAIEPPPDWWTILMQGEPPLAPASAAATNYLAVFEASMYGQRNRVARTWLTSTWASLIAGAGWGGGPLGNGSLQRLRIDLGAMQEYQVGQDDGPPEALYLAVRAARAAIAENPNDYRAWLVLGQVYFNLQRRTRERVLAPQYLQIVRGMQAAACLQQALVLKSDLEMAHGLLSEIFQSRFADLRLNHLTALHDSRKAAHVSEEQLEPLAKEIERMREIVEKQRDRFEVDAVNRHPVQRAQIALSNGLAEKAFEELRDINLEELEKSNGRQAVSAVADLTIRLLFATGRAPAARAVLGSPLRGALSALPELQLPAVEWYSLLTAAIFGDAEEADEHVTAMLTKTVDGPRAQAPVLVARYLLGEAQQSNTFPGNTTRIWPEPSPRLFLDQALQASRGSAAREGQLRLLRGVLALESGDLSRARQDIERALIVSSGPKAESGQEGPPLDPKTRNLARIYLEWLQSK